MPPSLMISSLQTNGGVERLFSGRTNESIDGVGWVGEPNPSDDRRALTEF